MKIYSLVLVTLHILVIGMAIGEQQKKSIITSSISLLMYLPIFGRILGWW